jgi:hypothetical protein
MEIAIGVGVGSPLGVIAKLPMIRDLGSPD